MIFKRVRIADLAANHDADKDILKVSLNGRRHLSGGLLGFSILIAFSFIGFAKVKSFIFSIVTLAMALFILVGRIVMYRRARSWIQVDKEELTIYGKLTFDWQDIDDVYYEEEITNEGRDFLVIVLNSSKAVRVPVFDDMSVKVEVVAAYINRFWKYKGDIL